MTDNTQPRDVNDRLTPDEVMHKQFTVVGRFLFRPGYAETEVDDFLDDVEATFVRLMRENEAYRVEKERTDAALPVLEAELGRLQRSLLWSDSILVAVNLRALVSLQPQGKKKPTIGESTLALDITELIGDLSASQKERQDATPSGSTTQGVGKEGSKQEAGASG